MNRVRTYADHLLEAFTVGLLLTLTVVVVSAVVYRKLGASLVWYDEIASILLAWLTYFGAALAALRRSHLGFASLLLAMPLPVRTAVFVFAEVLVFAFFAIVAWYGYLVLEILAFDRLISLPWLKFSVTQSVIPIGAALFIVAEALSLPEAWKEMRAGVDPEHKAIEEAIAQAEHDLRKAQ